MQAAGTALPLAPRKDHGPVAGMLARRRGRPRRRGRGGAVAGAGPGLLLERRLWARGFRAGAGADEVGRGPLAGPLVAAAVVFPPDVDPGRLRGVDDSKRLSPARREALVPRILAAAAQWAVAEVSAADVDRWNVGQASFEALRRAVHALRPGADHALLDGLPNPRLPHPPHTAVVGGDALSLSIAAASILAKVHRDREMGRLGMLYPGYGFGEHKGYPTAAHREALRRLGPSPVHRRSFRLGAGA
jgi:ribonuclease HII